MAIKRNTGFRFVIPSKNRPDSVSTISSLGLGDNDVTIVVNTRKEAEQYHREYRLVRLCRK